MRSTILIIFAALLAGCAKLPKAHMAATTPPAIASDPIDQLVTDLSATHGMWLNGMFPILDLPETASPEEVIERRFDMGLPFGKVANYKILRIRQIRIPFTENSSVLYTAVLVQTDSGKKIVLLKFTGRNWWSRVFDAKPSA
jgi:hypothetical protein